MNESQTMIIFVSDLFLKVNHKTCMIILGRSLPYESEGVIKMLHVFLHYCL
jgi:hypothetical protein